MTGHGGEPGRGPEREPGRGPERGPGREPIEQYLGELRGRLRVRDAHLILAEAEDHLREDVAAGRAAGLTEHEAQLAAISSFGSVRSVLRAHQPRWRRAAARLSSPALAVPKVVGLFLTTFSVTSLVSLIGLRQHLLSLHVVLLSHLIPGLVGLALVYGSRRVRHRDRSGAPAPVAHPVRFAAGATLLFGVAGAVLTGFGVAGAMQLSGPIIVACLALATGYAIRLGVLLRQSPAD